MSIVKLLRVGEALAAAGSVEIPRFKQPFWKFVEFWAYAPLAELT
jgi:hypothetical protein